MVYIKTAKQVIPQCYAYTTPGVPSHLGWTKIGFTERDVEERIREQTHTAGIEYKIEWFQLAQFRKEPYGSFTDTDFHSYLTKLGIERLDNTEWFHISPEDAEKHFDDFTKNHGDISSAKSSVIAYKLRPEQEMAVQKAYDYFSNTEKGEFLFNCKPRFGKSLSSYDLCKRLNAKHILIVTNRPAIANSWYQDYMTFLGPESGYAFVSTNDGVKNNPHVISHADYRMNQKHYKGFIEFISLQDLKGSIHFGGFHRKLEEVKYTKWDILIIDEAHEAIDTWKTDIAFNNISRKATLHLSGTPFKALANDKFPDNAIYNWTYADEQKAKRDWDNTQEEENPYASLPQLNMYTYQMSDIISDKVSNGIELADNDIEEYAFDLNEFFKVNNQGKFIHDSDVNKFLDALANQTKFPFSTEELRNELKHTFWILNRVDSAKALMKKLNNHPVFKDYYVIPAVGDGKVDDTTDNAGNKKSYDKVIEAIKSHDKTITLSVGQLTTGVTIKPWTAVLMLSSMRSSALYMQAAFRAQNPYLYTEKGVTYRKENAYVFDFDPARTLTIFEGFANDLIPENADGRGDSDSRKENVRELLNFFPVYGEDDNGEMILLDAEQVLVIPRHIHAREVVERGFMSNFLFSNISNIFGAPKEIIDMISQMQAVEEPKKLAPVPVDDTTADRLNINDDGEVDIPDEQVIGTAADIFGDKIYEDIEDTLDEVAEDEETKKPKEQDELKHLIDIFTKPATDALLTAAKEKYGNDMNKQTQNRLENQLKTITGTEIAKEYGNYKIEENKAEKKHQEELHKAQQSGASMQTITEMTEKHEADKAKRHSDMIDHVKEKMKAPEVVKEAAKTIVKTVETEIKKSEAEDIMGGVRNHLRGFSRTIPSFLMAYGNDFTLLSNFEENIPDSVFKEVTSITIDDFKLLRDGGDYVTEEGETKHFKGHLFDEVVFNDSITEFLKLKDKLADYFSVTHDKDIFDYIPPQKTNQIFTPKKTVQEMVNMLEKENPGCFDDDSKTFIDLYMKSGLYPAMIVTRLFNSSVLKLKYPNEQDRLKHIFEEQVYGLAPTEIIYKITTNFIFGFDKDNKISHNNFKLLDSLPYAEDGTLNKKLDDLFGDD